MALTYDQVPLLVGKPSAIAELDAILAAAPTQTQRFAWFDDSQGTSPGGNGSVFIPRLSWEFWRRTGKIGETMVAPCTNYGGGSPPAEWLLRGAINGTIGSGGLPTTRQLPGQSCARASTTSNGVTTMLLRHGEALLDTELTGPDYFPASSTLRFSIFARQIDGGANGITAISRPSDTANASFSVTPSTVIQSGNIGLNSAAGNIVRWDSPEGIDFYGGRTYANVQMRSNDLTNVDDVTHPVDFAGIRFWDSANPGGVIVQDFAKGGAKTIDLVNDHSESGPMFTAFGPYPLCGLGTSVNDFLQGKSAAQYKADVLTWIDFVRAHQSPSPLLILCPDNYISAGTSGQREQYAQAQGVAAEIAEADPDGKILAVNTRRVMEAFGMREGGPQLNLLLNSSDGVHQPPLGAQLNARTIAKILYREFPGSLVIGARY